MLVEAVDPAAFAAAILAEPSGGEARLERHIEALRVPGAATAPFVEDLQARVAYQLLRAEIR